MTQTPFPKFEVPADLKDMVEKSVSQARTAFDGFMTATHKAVTTIEDQSAAAQTQAREVAKKAVSQAETTMSEAFDHAQKLVRAKDLNEIVALQTAYLKTQMERAQAQAQDLGQSVTKVVSEAMNKVR
jgi:phasin